MDENNRNEYTGQPESPAGTPDRVPAFSVLPGSAPAPDPVYIVPVYPSILPSVARYSRAYGNMPGLVIVIPARNTLFK